MKHLILSFGITLAQFACFSTHSSVPTDSLANSTCGKVEFTRYIGPGRKNLIDQSWAEGVLASTSISEETHTFESAKIRKIYRKIAADCWLPDSQPIWFTAGDDKDPEHWKEDFIWHGHVRLVKDSITFDNGKIEIEYYLARGERAIKNRPTIAADLPKAHPEDWLRTQE